jgi:hypothetical protein
MVSVATNRPTNNTAKTGEIAWIGLVAYIIIYDILAIKTNRPTLSAAFHKASQSKMLQPLLVSFWFYLTAHLFQWIPKRYDIFRK